KPPSIFSIRAGKPGRERFFRRADNSGRRRPLCGKSGRGEIGPCTNPSKECVVFRLFCGAALVGLCALVLPARAEPPHPFVASQARNISKRTVKVAPPISPRSSELKKTPSKQRPLEFKDAYTWKMTGQPVLSRDGKWFACAIGTNHRMGET